MADVTKEMQQLSLVRAVFESALKNMPPMVPKHFDRTVSAKANIESFSKLFDCELKPDAILFGSLNEGETMGLLSKCDLFKNVGAFQVKEMLARIRDCVPVGFAEMDSVPPHLVHTARHESISLIRDER